MDGKRNPSGQKPGLISLECPLLTFSHCAVPDKVYTHPSEGCVEIPSGGGIYRVEILEAKYEAKLEFPGRKRGVKRKTFCGGSMDVFWNCTFHSQEIVNTEIYLILFLESISWSKPPVKGKPPAARDGHTACVVGSRIYIFGGYEEEVTKDKSLV